MTEIRKRAAQFAITYGIADNFNVGEYITFATAFTEYETDSLSKHILELQVDKDKLIDQNRQAKELLQNILDFEDGIITEFSRFDLTRWIIETKQFLKDGEKEK